MIHGTANSAVLRDLELLELTPLSAQGLREAVAPPERDTFTRTKVVILMTTLSRMFPAPEEAGLGSGDPAATLLVWPPRVTL